MFVIVGELEDEDEDEDDVSMMQRHQMCVFGLSSPAQLPWAWPTHTKDNYMTQAKMWRSQCVIMSFCLYFSFLSFCLFVFLSTHVCRRHSSLEKY